jgi:hypothetical protein
VPVALAGREVTSIALTVIPTIAMVRYTSFLVVPFSELHFPGGAGAVVAGEGG